jgi:DNA-binding response OmpR family regulator
MTVIYLDQYRKAKVLIVAADRHIAEVLCEFFLTNELKVELVDSLERILPTMSKNRADMVLLTSFGLTPNQIPSFVTAIKDEYPGIGVTVLSGDESIKSDVMSRGADVFMPAPFCFKELLGRIKIILAVK